MADWTLERRETKWFAPERSAVWAIERPVVLFIADDTHIWTLDPRSAAWLVPARPAYWRLE